MIVAGFGLRAGTQLQSLVEALNAAQAGHPPVAALAVPEDRTALLHPLAELTGLPLVPVPPEAIAGAATATQSAASLAARGTGSVAEAAALAAAGPGAVLLAPRVVSGDRMATCALARGGIA